MIENLEFLAEAGGSNEHCCLSRPSTLGSQGTDGDERETECRSELQTNLFKIKKQLEGWGGVSVRRTS